MSAITPVITPAATSSLSSRPASSTGTAFSRHSSIRLCPHSSSSKPLQGEQVVLPPTLTEQDGVIMGIAEGAGIKPKSSKLDPTATLEYVIEQGGEIRVIKLDHSQPQPPEVTSETD